MELKQELANVISEVEKLKKLIDPQTLVWDQACWWRSEKINLKLAEISKKVNDMAAAIDDLQRNSFQRNVKIAEL